MTAPLSPETPPPAVLYFDGVCNLCNRFIDFLIRHDRVGRFRYASQQGESFAALLERYPALRTVDTLVLVVQRGAGETVYKKSSAALTAMSRLPGLWKLAGVLKAVPLPLRDLVYDWVARNRYGWFGKRASCRLPSPQERALFLD
jgi:predicted DCC family thiol-disulfide oxidoreductase YuxK